MKKGPVNNDRAFSILEHSKDNATTSVVALLAYCGDAIRLVRIAIADRYFTVPANCL